MHMSFTTVSCACDYSTDSIEFYCVFTTAAYGGYCNNADECICKDGFTGDNCEIRM